MNREKQARLREITAKLSEILGQDTDEQVMVFTDDKTLKELCGQINLLLPDRQKMKTDFRKQEIALKKMLANISHDIKTPLTDQFFTPAKPESGDKNIEMVQVNINELCRENVLVYYELLVQKDYAVDIIIPEQHIFVQGDRESVSRILGNLLSNAIRYGSDGKYIGLFLREELDFVYIDVVDKGKGIEKQFAASVFERLYTMEDSRNRSIQGNGLGLTIARNLARQMGGDILLQSEPGVRTVFTVKLRRWGDC